MAAFQQIKSISSSLLQHRSHPSELSSQLRLLHSVMVDFQSGLTPLRDYLLFPLMLILDSVHPSRSGNGQDQPPVPAAKSNRVVEATLTCLSLLLQAVAKRQDEASSESRAMILESNEDRLDQCLELLQRIMPILALVSPQSDKGPPQINTSLSDEAATLSLGCISTILDSLPVESYPRSEEGPFLPIVGFLISTMIQIGGASESPSVKLAALKTLCTIITVLRGYDDARETEGGEALAFFLPGIIGGLAKILLGLGSSSSSSLSSCSVAALKCLADVLSSSFGDRHASLLLPAGGSSQPTESLMTIDETLRRIQDLALNSSTGHPQPMNPLSPANSHSPTTTLSAPPSQPSAAERPSFLVKRTKDWLIESGSKVSPLLLRLLPPLCTHTRASVRAAVASLAANLLSLPSAVNSLGSLGQGVLLEIVLTLAHDDSILVSQPCIKFILQSSPSPSETSSSIPPPSHLAAASASMLESLIAQLPDCVKRGEASAILMSRKLSNAMLLSGPNQACALLIQRPAVLLNQVLDNLAQCLAFSQDGASTSALSSNCGGHVLLTSPDNISTESDPQTVTKAATAPSLPRMPSGLTFISSIACYEAVAGVARTLGYMARAEDIASGMGSCLNLQRLIDVLLARIDPLNNDMHWQLTCSAEVTLFSEILFGASSAWLPKPFESSPSCSSNGFSSPPSKGIKRSHSLPPLEFKHVSMIHDLIPTLLGSKVWGASAHTSLSAPHLDQPSSLSSSSSEGKKADGPAAAARNSLLSRCLLEALGTIARCLGRGLVGKPLRLMLMPLMERLADPNLTVRSSAQASLASVCLHCGYHGGLKQLLSANADWVVDSVCRQMRDLAHHPRAPQLMSALLTGGGGAGSRGDFASPALLKLLAEPLGAAIRGLSISSRRAHASSSSTGVEGGGYSMCFLRVLLHVSHCARSEAKEVEAETLAALSCVREECKQYELASKHKGGENVAGGDLNEEGDDESARAFFSSRIASKKRKDEEIGGVDLGSSNCSPGDAVISDCPFFLGEVEQRSLEARLDRQQVAASLANDTFEAALPLISSRSLHESVLALQVCLESLHSLSSSTKSMETDTRMLEEVGGAREARVGPVRPEAPKILPAVATIWPMLILGLKDPRLPVVEKSLETLSAAACLGGGDFLSNRFRSHAFPTLLKLLKHGPSTTRTSEHPSLLEVRGEEGGGLRLGSGAGDRDEALATDAIMRVRMGVLHCLASFASSPPSTTATTLQPLSTLFNDGNNEDGLSSMPKTSRSMQSMAWDLASAALPYLFLKAADEAAITAAKGAGVLITRKDGDQWRERVGKAAVDLVLCTARLDPDAIWLLIHDLLLTSSQGSKRSSRYNGISSPNDEKLPQLSIKKGPARVSSSTSSPSSPCSMWPVTQSLREDEEVVKAATYIMNQIESFDVCPWHDQVPSVVPDW